MNFMSWSKSASDEIQYLVEWYSAHVNQYDLDHRAFSFSIEKVEVFFPMKLNGEKQNSNIFSNDFMERTKI